MRTLKTSIPLFLILCSVVYCGSPKNVIFYIGDGMGYEQVEAAELYTGVPMSFNDPTKFPYDAECTTYSLSSSGGIDAVTDSAAAATALATGVKVKDGVISNDIPGGNGEPLLTLLEVAQAQGKSVGLITTAYLTHATPASFGAHEDSRSNYTAIGQDYLTGSLPNVMFGGGKNGFDVLSSEAAGYTVVTDMIGFQNLEPTSDDHFSGQFGSGYMPYKAGYFTPIDTDNPTYTDEDYQSYPFPMLDEMVAKAISILSLNPKGFFLMVEGGRVDHACHSNLLEESVHEVIDFSNAVDTGYNWASVRTDTLILVTADHETGDLTVDADNGAGNYPDVTFSSTGHTGVNVPVYAMGVNANMINGAMDNTDMFEVCTADNTPVYEATNPYPDDTLIDVEADVELSWTTGIYSVNHHLTLWDASDPTILIVDQLLTVNQYILPNVLSANTIYNWKVDEYDDAMVLLAGGTTWGFTTIDVPTAAMNLSPADGAVVPVNVDLSWTAGENVEEYWVYLDTAANPAIVVSKQAGTTYSATGLDNSTGYNWKVESINSAGSVMSAVAGFVTEDLPGPEEKYAFSENTVAGEMTSGGMSMLELDDENYEEFTETLNVPNKNGYSTLEHVWTFEIGNSVSAEFYVEAFKSLSQDGDDFVFSYSTDGVIYQDMVTVTSIVEDTPLVYAFPVSPTGTVYVRVTDTDHTKKNQSMDQLFVDVMYIFASEGAIIKHYAASDPDPFDGAVDVPVGQVLSWTAGDDALSHNVYFGESDPDDLSGPYVVTGSTTFDPVEFPQGIKGNTVYFWRVDEVRADGTTTGGVWRYTTEDNTPCTVTELVKDSIVLTTLRGSKGKEYGVATVTIKDNCGSLVEGATVTGSFTGDFAGDTDMSVLTNENGIAVFISSTEVRKASFGFDVTSIITEGVPSN